MEALHPNQCRVLQTVTPVISLLGGTSPMRRSPQWAPLYPGGRRAYDRPRRPDPGGNGQAVKQPRRVQDETTTRARLSRKSGLIARLVNRWWHARDGAVAVRTA